MRKEGRTFLIDESEPFNHSGLRVAEPMSSKGRLGSGGVRRQYSADVPRRTRDPLTLQKIRPVIGDIRTPEGSAIYNKYVLGE